MTTEERFAGILSKLNDNEFSMLERYFKEEEQKKIKKIINNYWIEKLKIEQEKWTGKFRGNECIEGYLIFTNGDVEEILKEIEKTEGKNDN
jgi:hypothetical protein